MAKTILLLCLMGLAMGLHLQTGFTGGAYSLRQEGQYLIQCPKCAPSVNPLAALIKKTSTTPFDMRCIWRVMRSGDGFLFKANSGQYLTLEKSLNLNSRAAIVQGSGGTRWKAEKANNNKWAFKSPDNKYLGKCTLNGQDYACAGYDKSSDPKAQWSIISLTD